MIKKLFLIFNFIILTGCTSLISYNKEIPKADFVRKESSQLAVVSAEYAGDNGIEIIINNKTNKLIKILWNLSSINNEPIISSDVTRKYMDIDEEQEFLIPDFAYKRVVFPKSKIEKFSDRSYIIKNLEYPLTLKIVFRNKYKTDQTTLFIKKGKKEIKKVTLDGHVVDN